MSPIATYPPTTGGGIKSVQRGVSTAAESVTITSVTTSKTWVRSFSTASSGNVATNQATAPANQESWAGEVLFGTTFAAGQRGAYLSDATTLVTTGPCRWEVIEYA